MPGTAVPKTPEARDSCRVSVLTLPNMWLMRSCHLAAASAAAACTSSSNSSFCSAGCSAPNSVGAPAAWAVPAADATCNMTR